MPNRRYHIHLACVAHDQPVILDGLALFFENKAFLTRDLRAIANSEAMQYSRRCIDVCDYVLVLVADSYGEKNPSGVSQLHLSYITAKTKNKPMMVLLKSDLDEETISRELSDFIKLIKNQQKSHVHYYHEETDLSQLLDYAFSELQTEHVGLGWVRSKPNDACERAIDKYSHSLLSTKPLPQLTNFESRLSDEEQHAQKLEQIDERQVMIQSLHLNDVFSLHYTAHAFAEGNLSEVALAAALTWQEILNLLMHLPSHFSSQSLLKALNDLVSQQAISTVKERMPKVHAVSRCQVTQADLLWIQEELIALGWIQLINAHTKILREIWQITDYAKQLFASRQEAQAD